MKQWKGFLAGAFCSLFAVALVVTAGAKTGTVTQELTYRDIRVSLDGKVLDLRNAIGEPVEPFMFGGTNYLPVRALAEALGLNVAWDGAEVMVVLTSPEPPSVELRKQEEALEGRPEDWAARYPMEQVPPGMPVYVTPTGKHWHFNGTCNGGTYIQSTYNEALKLGLTPCDKCVLTIS